MSSTTKQTLVPLSVPWKVDSGFPRLQLFAFESGSDKPTHVHLTAFFGPIQASSETIVTDDGSAHERHQEGLYRDVEISFHGFLACRLLPSFSDSENIQESLYDWSIINIDYSIVDGIDAFRGHF